MEEPTTSTSPSVETNSLADARLIRALGTRRASLTFVAIVFATTALQVLSNPLAAVLDGEAVWQHPLPLATLSLFVVFGCAAQAAALLLCVPRPGIAALLTVSSYVGLIVWLGVPNWVAPMAFVVAIAMFLLAAQTSTRVAVAWLVVVTAIASAGLLGWALSTGASLGVVSGFFLENVAAFLVPAAGATALGIWWGIQSRRTTRVQAAAEMAAREYEERIEKARIQERARIAQELHDVSAQHIAGLLSLADAAIDIEIREPAQALSLIEDIRTEGRFASASLYAALRDLQVVDGQQAERTPDLGKLPGLAEYWSRRGMALRVNANLDVTELPAVVSTSAYRAIQESLTNAAKHAPGAAVAVDVVLDKTHLRVTVVNSRARDHRLGREVVGLGWGLEGLAQRLELLSGSFHAGPTAEGGWLVTMEAPVYEIETPVARVQ